MRPAVGRKPYVPQQSDGIRIDPEFVSELDFPYFNSVLLTGDICAHAKETSAHGDQSTLAPGGATRPEAGIPGI